MFDGPSLSLGIDATGAKQGADEYQRAVSEIQNSAREAARANEELGKSTAELGTKTKPATQGVKDVEKAVDSLGKELEKGNVSVGKFGRNLNTLERDLDRVGKTATSTSGGLKSMDAVVSGLVGGLAAGLVTQLPQLIGSAIQLADSFTQMDNILKVATGSSEEAAAQYQRLFAIAQEGHTDIGSLVQLFGRLAIVQDQIGASTSDMEGVLKGVTNSLRITGTSSAEASGALRQLGQAFASPIVQAEEF